MKNFAETKREPVYFDTSALTILQSVFKDEPAMAEECTKTASVKFMITLQDEKELRKLGYGQARIDSMKPQEAREIILSGVKATAMPCE